MTRKKRCRLQGNGIIAGISLETPNDQVQFRTAIAFKSEHFMDRGIDNFLICRPSKRMQQACRKSQRSILSWSPY